VAVLRDAARRSSFFLPGSSGAPAGDLERLLEACAAHYALLLQWNRTHNLTRITAPEEAARKHYLDCLVPLLGQPPPPAFVDVGAGAGFPGLMAALLWPRARAVLIEPAKKRASFLTLAAAAMGVEVEVRPPPVVGSTVGSKALAAAPLAPLVLSRATFSPGQRHILTSYAAVRGEEQAAEEQACIAVWGHPHDAATWENEVATWGGWRATFRGYAVDGLEPRALLVAQRGSPR
jgi:hypothetical protein